MELIALGRGLSKAKVMCGAMGRRSFSTDLLKKSSQEGCEKNLIMSFEPSPNVLQWRSQNDVILCNQPMKSPQSEGEGIVAINKISNLPRILKLHGFLPLSFDKIYIDTNTSSPDPLLDFRRASSLTQANPLNAREALAHLNEHSLWRMMRKYSRMVSEAKYVTNAIIESRYMFQQFSKVEDLVPVIETASRNMLRRGVADAKFSQGELLSDFMLRELLSALQSLVNDDLNELHYGIDVVAKNFLKPRGQLSVAVRPGPKQQIVQSLLDEIRLKQENRDKDRPYVEFEASSDWRMISKDEVMVSEDSNAKNEILYVAEKCLVGHK